MILHAVPRDIARWGLALVKNDGLYGFIDLEGQWVIKPQFQNTSAFH
jgi:hypothetical protein